MIGMSQQSSASKGIKVSQSPGGKSSFQFAYQIQPIRHIKSACSTGKSTLSLAWDQKQTFKSTKVLPLSQPSSISLAWQTKQTLKKKGIFNPKYKSPEVRSYYESGKVVERAGSPKPSVVRVNCPPGGHSSIKFG